MNCNWEKKKEVEISFINRVNGKNKTIKKKVRSWLKRKDRKRRKTIKVK